MIKLLLISLLVLALNVPFGYWRANVKRFSLQWYLAIHVPVVFVVTLRIVFHLGFAWYTYVFMLAAFFMGQKFGGHLIKRARRVCDRVTSCMVMDLLRCSI